MKAIALSIIMLAVTAAAQAPPPGPPPMSKHVPPGVGPQTPPTPTPAPPQAIPVEPKHSEATATLRAIEAEKADLRDKAQNAANQANAIIFDINKQLAAKDKEAAEQQEKVKKENGWGDEVHYVPTQQEKDGSTTLGHWEKAEKK